MDVASIFTNLKITRDLNERSSVTAESGGGGSAQRPDLQRSSRSNRGLRFIFRTRPQTRHSQLRRHRAELRSQRQEERREAESEHASLRQLVQQAARGGPVDGRKLTRGSRPRRTSTSTLTPVGNIRSAPRASCRWAGPCCGTSAKGRIFRKPFPDDQLGPDFIRRSSIFEQLADDLHDVSTQVRDVDHHARRQGRISRLQDRELGLRFRTIEPYAAVSDAACRASAWQDGQLDIELQQADRSAVHRSAAAVSGEDRGAIHRLSAIHASAIRRPTRTKLILPTGARI